MSEGLLAEGEPVNAEVVRDLFDFSEVGLVFLAKVSEFGVGFTDELKAAVLFEVDFAVPPFEGADFWAFGCGNFPVVVFDELVEDC